MDLFFWVRSAAHKAEPPSLSSSARRLSVGFMSSWSLEVTESNLLGLPAACLTILFFFYVKKMPQIWVQSAAHLADCFLYNPEPPNLSISAARGGGHLGSVLRGLRM